MGPRACSLLVLIAISEPSSSVGPSLSRREPLTTMVAASTRSVNSAVATGSVAAIASLCPEPYRWTNSTASPGESTATTPIVLSRNSRPRSCSPSSSTRHCPEDAGRASFPRLHLVGVVRVPDPRPSRGQASGQCRAEPLVRLVAQRRCRHGRRTCGADDLVNHCSPDLEPDSSRGDSAAIPVISPADASRCHRKIAGAMVIMDLLIVSSPLSMTPSTAPFSAALNVDYAEKSLECREAWNIVDWAAAASHSTGFCLV